MEKLKKLDVFLLGYFIKLSHRHSNKINYLKEKNIESLSDLIILNPEQIVSNFDGFGWSFISKMQKEFNLYNIYFGMSKIDYISVISKSDKIQEFINIPLAANTNKYSSSIENTILDIPRIFNIIKIEKLSPLLNNIPDSEKLKFSSSVLNSFSNIFNTIGDLKKNIRTKEDLLNLDHFGKKKIDLLILFFSGYFNNYEILIEFLINNKVHDLKQLNYSYNVNMFLDRYNIKSLEDLKKFVKSNELDTREYNNEYDKFNDLELLALLELLTFHIKFDRIQTSALVTEKNINLNKCVDIYFDKLISKESLTQIALYKFEYNYTLNGVGEELNITRERVRQIVKKFCDNFNVMFLFSFSDINKALFDECLEKNKPVDISFSCFSKSEQNFFSEKFYLNFLSYFFNSITKKNRNKNHINIGPPFKNTIQGIDHPIVSKLPDFSFRLKDLVNEDNGYKAIISLMYHLFPKERKYLDDTILKTEYGTHPLIKLQEKKFKLDANGYIYNTTNVKKRIKMIDYIFKCFNETTLHINEIGSLLLSNDIFDIKIEDIFREKSPIHGAGYDNALYTDCGRIEGILMFDRQVFGTRNCFNCTFDDWKEIRDLSFNLIKDTGHELSAFEIFAYVKKFVKKLSNKYELVNILRDDYSYLDFDSNKLAYIHPFRFTLKNLSHKSKSVKSIMIDILENSSKPLRAEDLHMQINKRRSYRIEGMPIMAKQTSGKIKLYGGSYYGLSSNEKINLDFLSTDITFIKSLLIYSFAHEVCFLDDFIEHISFEGKKNDFKKMIIKEKNIKIVPTSFNNFDDNQIILIVLKANLVNNIKKIIKAFDIALSWFDIEYILSEFLDIKVINPKNSRGLKKYKIGSRKISVELIKKELKEDLSIILNKGKYSIRKLNKNNFSDIVEECLKILNDEMQQFDIEELHNEVGASRIKVDELLYLLSKDKRFSIRSNRELYLTSWI